MPNSISAKINLFENISHGVQVDDQETDAMVQELKDVSLQRGSTGSSSCSNGGSSGGLSPSGLLTGSRPPSFPVPVSRLDPEGLIIPKKLPNPCIESREAQELTREIRWNAKVGVNVLATKSELQKAMEKRNHHRKIQEKKSEENSNKTPFQIKLEERAKRLEMLDKAGNPVDDVGSVSEDSGHCSPEPESEFLKMHAQLLGKGNGTAV